MSTFHLFDRCRKVLGVRRTPGIPPTSTSFHPFPPFPQKKGKTPFSTSPIPPSPPSPAPWQITWRLLGADETIRGCLCLGWQFTQFTPSESPMTSVSFTVLSETTHDNLLCSGRLSILAITGVSDTIPPRLLLPRGAPSRRSRRSRAQNSFGRVCAAALLVHSRDGGSGRSGGR